MPTAMPTSSRPPSQVGVSLARQLLLWLLLPQLVLWMGGSIATYRLASGYVNQAIDASLLQASRALARQLKPIGTGLLIDFPRAAQDILEADPSDRLLYTVSSPPGQFILGNQSLPTPPVDAPLAINEPYFFDGSMPHKAGQNAHAEPLRIVALRLALGQDDGTPQTTLLVQVAKSRASREELAQRILVDMLLPMSVLVLLMTVIVWAGIRAGLAPLKRLTQQVEGRAASDLRPVQLASAPRELVSLASALNSLLGAAQDNVATQKRFIGDAAHQLRTPLAGLKSQTEIALQSTTDPELHARLERVHQSATRSAHLVNQLLTLARAEPESAMAQNRQRFDLQRMARQLTAEMVPRALRQHADLGMDDSHDPDSAEAAPVWVTGNELLVREALTNVIDNALHYAGESAQVTVRVSAAAPWARLEVTDNGPGIDPADRSRVMERFVRATDTGNGCGLGLAIVQEITQRHAGRVHLSSAQPHGLHVTLELPLTS